MKMIRAKTDRVDARVISNYGYYQTPYMFKPKPENAEKITLYLKGIDDLFKTKTQFINRLEALSYQFCKCEDLTEIFKNMIKQIEHNIKELGRVDRS